MPPSPWPLAAATVRNYIAVKYSIVQCSLLQYSTVNNSTAHYSTQQDTRLDNLHGHGGREGPHQRRLCHSRIRPPLRCVLYSTLHCIAVQYSAVQCSTELYFVRATGMFVMLPSRVAARTTSFVGIPCSHTWAAGLVGRSGRGETTFLKHMAMHAIDGIPRSCQVLVTPSATLLGRPGNL